MTTDATDFVDFERAFRGDRIESVDGNRLSVAGDGRLPLLMYEEDRIIPGETQRMMVERVAQVSDLGQHNLISAKALAKKLDASIQVHTTAAVIRPHYGGK